MPHYKKRKNMKNALISGFILLVIGGLITKFVFNDKVELRYVVSDRIPTNFFVGNESESIQQLELLNAGDVELNRVIIKIKANIKEYEIQKIASSDSIIVTRNNGFLEIIYPQIPPDGNVKIIIKSIGDGVNYGDLDIKHSKGSAKPALESNNTINYLYYGLVFFYLVLIVFGIRTTVVDSIAVDVYHKPYNKILKKSKPWFVPANKWRKFRDDSMEYIFNYDSYANIANSLCFQILDLEKHKSISNEEWIKLKLVAQEKLLNSISEDVNKGYNWKIEEFLSLKQPKNIDENVWLDIKSVINKAYITTLIFKVDNYTDDAEITELLKQEKPQIISERNWEKYQSFLLKLKSMKEKSIENDILQERLKLLMCGEKLNEKPDELSVSKWEKLKKIETEIFVKSEQISEELSEIEQIKSTTIPLSTKLEKQLKIINEVLTDPTAIDRIEDYENPFSIGNFENLKQIAKLKNQITKA